MWENLSDSAPPLFNIAPSPPRATASASPDTPAHRFPRLRRPDTRPRVLLMNGSRTLTLAVEGPMIPTQPPPSKRKATDDANPLAATAGKKLKREVRGHVGFSPHTRAEPRRLQTSKAGPSNKRKREWSHGY